MKSRYEEAIVSLNIDDTEYYRKLTWQYKEDLQRVKKTLEFAIKEHEILELYRKRGYDYFSKDYVTLSNQIYLKERELHGN